MVIYLARRIKMGEGRERRGGGLSPSQPKHDEERAIEPFGGVGVE
jgi:hypothetical protein